MRLDRIISLDESAPDAIRAAVERLGVDETLGIETDLHYEHRVKMAEALGRGWKLRFRQSGDVIWTRSVKSVLSVPILPRPLAYYVNRLTRGEPFSFLRYGDMLAAPAGTLYEGFSFQTFTPALCEAIKRTLLGYHPAPRYIMALAPPYHFKRLGLWGHVVHWMHENGLNRIEWHDSEVFYQAQRAGELGPFVRALRNLKTLIVGPRKLEALTDEALPDARFHFIAPTECYSEIDLTMTSLITDQWPDVICFSAGPAAVVMIYRLFPAIGHRVTMISVGSLWGPFVGRPEHESQREITPEVMRRNMGRGG